VRPRVHHTASRDRGQGAIGTVVVLIAALLIATMAAGALFETTDLLSSETDETSDEVRERLTGRLDVVAASGVVANGTVEAVNLTVRPAGSGTVDLRELTIGWVGPAGARTLVYASSNTTAGPNFGARAVGSSGLVLESDRDRAVLTLDPGGEIDATHAVDGRTVDIATTGPALSPGGSVGLTFTTGSGSRTSHELRVPRPLPDQQRVAL
jgi:archaellin